MRILAAICLSLSAGLVQAGGIEITQVGRWAGGSVSWQDVFGNSGTCDSSTWPGDEDTYTAINISTSVDEGICNNSSSLVGGSADLLFSKITPQGFWFNLDYSAASTTSLSVGTGGGLDYMLFNITEPTTLVFTREASWNITGRATRRETFQLKKTGYNSINYPLFDTNAESNGVEMATVTLTIPGQYALYIDAGANVLNSPTNVENGFVTGSFNVTMSVEGVSIDVDPWSESNNVTPDSTDVIPVAVHTMSLADGDAFDFDALQIDPATLKFGSGQAANVATPLVSDIDGDSDTDVTFGFIAGDSGILCEDTDVTLSGETYAGEAFSGMDAIITPECEGGCHP